MSSHTKNKVKHRNLQAAREDDEYNEDTLTESHKLQRVELTPWRAHGYTTVKTYLRDAQQMRALIQHQNRFKPGKKAEIFGNWDMNTDAHGVTYCPDEYRRISEVKHQALGPGAFGKIKEHIKTAPKPGKTQIAGPDINEFYGNQRRIGTVVLPLRSREHCLYTTQKIANDLVRYELANNQNRDPKAVDERRQQERKNRGKRTLSEISFDLEWEFVRRLTSVRNSLTHHQRPAPDLSESNP